MKKKCYTHFLLLVYAIKILICVETCCEQFAKDYSIFYGSHNLPISVLIHGPLDNFSCFQYENYLNDIKKSIKSTKYTLQEIFNRIIESEK